MHATDNLLPGSLLTANLLEAERLMAICNACRYCEGLCAVFPAMEMRRSFDEGDLNYLANLCHQCGACYDDCQYSPPHEFRVNVPATLAKVRNDSYKAYAWPSFLSGTFDRNGLAITLATAGSAAAFLIGFVALRDPFVLLGRHGGSFYAVMPHNVMAGLFGGVALYACLTFVMSLRAFWRDVRGQQSLGGNGVASLWQAMGDVGRLRYLDGGGGGCTSETSQPSGQRRLFHHLTFYGFLLCFAATSVATLYHYLFGWHAPYAFFSLPVLLGSVGGAGLLAGPLGLYMLQRRRNPELVDLSKTGMNTAFIVMLFLTSLTGFLLLGLRNTSAMGILLAIHLGVVLGLFLSLPYGKFVHGLYRFLALLKYAGESRSSQIVE